MYILPSYKKNVTFNECLTVKKKIPSKYDDIIKVQPNDQGCWE